MAAVVADKQPNSQESLPTCRSELPCKLGPTPVVVAASRAAAAAAGTRREEVGSRKGARGQGLPCATARAQRPAEETIVGAAFAAVELALKAPAPSHEVAVLVPTRAAHTELDHRENRKVELNRKWAAVAAVVVAGANRRKAAAAAAGANSRRHWVALHTCGGAAASPEEPL